MNEKNCNGLKLPIDSGKDLVNELTNSESLSKGRLFFSKYNGWRTLDTK